MSPRRTSQVRQAEVAALRGFGAEKQEEAVRLEKWRFARV